MNALNSQVLRERTQALAELEENFAVGAVILTGPDKALAAGAWN